MIACQLDGVQRCGGRTIALVVLFVMLAVRTPAAFAQAEQTPGAPPAAVQRQIRQGQGDLLARRFGTSNNPPTLHWVAQAYANAGRAADDKAARDRAFEQAVEFHQRRIAALGETPRASEPQRAVAVAEARLELARLIVNDWNAPRLDEHFLTSGLRTDHATLAERYAEAREQYRAAAEVLDPLIERLRANEDEFIVLGIYDDIRRGRLDTEFGGSWTEYYYGLMRPDDPAQQRQAWRVAAEGFRDLTNSRYVGATIYPCYLGLGLALRGLGEWDSADEALQRAAQEGASPALQVRARYATGQLRLAQGRFDDARQVLEPLARQNVRELPEDRRPAMFYYNLAKIAYANSYLREAAAIRDEAEASISALAKLRAAQRVRERGIRAFRALADQGGSWPALAQLYVSASIDRNADPAQLSPIELLYSARDLASVERYAEAQRRLERALAAAELSGDLRGELLFELGTTLYRQDQLRAAAARFAELARELPRYAKAAEAAGYAYRLQSQIADATGAAGDYATLAKMLRTLLERYPQHEDRATAQWLLPLALQQAGEFTAAAQAFAAIPRSSEKHAEARFRQLVALRLALESARAELGAARFREAAMELAVRFQRYPAAAEPTAAERPWARRARLNAAELMVIPALGAYEEALEIASALSDDAELGEALRGRVLGVRLKALQGLRDFEAASRMLDRFLAEVPAEQAGAILTALAKGMREEVERLAQAGHSAAARQLAREAVSTFRNLQAWVEQGPERARFADFVQRGLAEMHYLAGNLDRAQELAEAALADDAQRGTFRLLLARILTAQAERPNGGVAAQTVAQTAAREAWAQLLTDRRLRTAEPAVYWEARYHWLRLMLAQGEAAAVKQAITQERVWYPELGGPAWKPKFEALLADAEAALAGDGGAESPAPPPAGGGT